MSQVSSNREAVEPIIHPPKLPARPLAQATVGSAPAALEPTWVSAPQGGATSQKSQAQKSPAVWRGLSFFLIVDSGSGRC